MSDFKHLILIKVETFNFPQRGLQPETCSLIISRRDPLNPKIPAPLDSPPSVGCVPLFAMTFQPETAEKGRLEVVSKDPFEKSRTFNFEL